MLDLNICCMCSSLQQLKISTRIASNIKISSACSFSRHSEALLLHFTFYKAKAFVCDLIEIALQANCHLCQWFPLPRLAGEVGIWILSKQVSTNIPSERVMGFSEHRILKGEYSGWITVASRTYNFFHVTLIEGWRQLYVTSVTTFLSTVISCSKGTFPGISLKGTLKAFWTSGMYSTSVPTSCRKGIWASSLKWYHKPLHRHASICFHLKIGDRLRIDNRTKVPCFTIGMLCFQRNMSFEPSPSYVF